MDMAETLPELPHKLKLDERKSLLLTGVTEVLRFDEGMVVLQTTQGALAVHGTGLQLKALSPEYGQAAVEGGIIALVYQERTDTRLWRRLFR